MKHLSPGIIALKKMGIFVLLAVFILTGCKKIDTDPLAGESGRPPGSPGSIDIMEIAGNFTSPLGVVAVPDETGRMMVIDQVGKLWILEEDGTVFPQPFIDITSSLVTLNPNYDERGLLGLAFHPDYDNNGRFYVYYQVPPNAGGPEPGVSWNNLTIISEFQASASDPNMADLSTERRLLEIDDPQSNHNGGTLAFGRDGYLYISLGDAGAANDVAPGHVPDWYAVNEGGNGQDIENNLFGSMLRIDVNGNPYSIPPDNPFVNKPGMDEIYAYGFRNPYRFSFDMGGSGRMYVGDAGQVLYEEINMVEKGGNYGWNVKEGNICFDAANNMFPLNTCPDMDVYGTRLSDPNIVINHWLNPAGGKATTVIGGNVYRGHEIPGLQGKYIFGTFSQTPTTPNGELYMSIPAGNGTWSYQEIMLASNPSDIGYYLKGFGQDMEGEIYLTVTSVLGPSGSTGKVLKLVKAG